MYLIRRNFRAYKFSRICSARKLEIFARINFRAPLHFQILITCYMAIETKNRGQFCKNLTRKYFRARKCKNSVLILQFCARKYFQVKFSQNWPLFSFLWPYSRSLKFENVSAQKLIRAGISNFCAEQMRENLYARKFLRIR